MSLPMNQPTAFTPNGNLPRINLSPVQRIALLLLHVATAGWIGYGAFVKAAEFNPLLLPPPILAAITAIIDRTSVDATAFLEWSLRAIIGVEIFIALAILTSRWARQIAIATLSLFCIILLIAMVQAGLKANAGEGFKEALAGSCGCFGKAGLPASVMFLIDAALLSSALLLVPRQAVRGRLPIAIPALIGLVAIFAIPTPEVQNDSNDAAKPPIVVTPTDPSTLDGPWPAAPVKYEKNYFTKWPEWVGKPFRAQKLALAIERPLPDDLERGDWIVVFSRTDCDRCQELYRAHFATPRKERVLKVSIPDTTGQPLAMPCEGCESRLLYRVKAGQSGTSPNYLVTAPTVIRLKDGIVTAVCPDVDKLDDLKRVLGEEPTVSVAPPVKPEISAWPGPPSKLEPFYIAEFPGAIGQPIAANKFARMIAGGVPADFLTGRWIIVFYREDCDHCQELLTTYFSGKLPVRSLAVAIPDADPNNLLDNPCDECVKVSLVKGPNYVIGTPVIVAINNGVIECVVVDAEDMAALEACLKFAGK